ncbi:hypothetical protein GN958_ATG13112 [Phytophthora infestans]|uniref:Uncharacterized protein n=1 Tax=Phytophthora infestans TaxID=4787 RepID=A0A8S9UA05_PHYIN|nr:hypothetical protein GN958_ATG13112 [Phytophthora infestans]
MSRQPGNRDDGSGVSHLSLTVSQNQRDVPRHVAIRNGADTQPLRVNTLLTSEGQFHGLSEYSQDLPPLEKRRQVVANRGVAQDFQGNEDVGYDAEFEEDGEQESTDISTDNGESSGSSLEQLEPQQWSEMSPTQTAELSGENQGEVPCRVSWCTHAGNLHELCWAHGGVQKCCHRNCPKIALATREFCSVHERKNFCVNFPTCSTQLPKIPK